MRQILAVLISIFLISCTTTSDITGREQFIIIPASQDRALGLEAMQEVRKTAKIVKDGPLADKVRRIGERIAAVSDQPDLDWEFVVIDEDQLNAWALPGGKVAIYTKMLNEIGDDTQIAAVIGHEIAHAVLRHGAEQLSRAQAQNIAIVGLGAVVGATTDSEETSKLAIALGSMAATGLVQLPHSRAMELEADHVGTMYMAKAGYDPRAAVKLWHRMAALKGEGGSVPAFLSTHPTDTRRIEELESKMPYYMGIYSSN